MAVLGGHVISLSRPEFERYMVTETVKRSNLIRSNKIVLDN